MTNVQMAYVYAASVILSVWAFISVYDIVYLACFAVFYPAITSSLIPFSIHEQVTFILFAFKTSSFIEISISIILTVCWSSVLTLFFIMLVEPDSFSNIGLQLYCIVHDSRFGQNVCNSVNFWYRKFPPV